MNELPQIIKPPPSQSRRVLLTVSYDGTKYAGWQRQLNALAVQQVIEEALQSLTGESMRVTGASRTDAGVHALGQRAHFDTSSTIPPDKFPFALNTRLPEDIRITSGYEAPPDFHARFDAIGKTYHYRVHNAPHASALWRDFCAHVPQKLDLDAMRESLLSLVGTHDFAAFEAAGGTAKTTVRTIESAELAQQGEMLTLTVKGNAFLYNMVRIIAGTMLDIGMGRLGKDAFKRALETRDRLSLGITAPAKGLELHEVRYPPALGL